MENRDNRRRAKQLSANMERMDEVDADLAQNSLTAGVERVGGWRKSPDTPLGVCVANRKVAEDFRRRLNRRKRGLPPED